MRHVIPKEPGFSITDGKGFHITFENGWTVSVQFGQYNYCHNRNYRATLDFTALGGAAGCEDAEVAAWPNGGEMCSHGPGFENDSVAGWRTPAQVLELMVWAAAQDKTCNQCNAGNKEELNEQEAQ